MTDAFPATSSRMSCAQVEACISELPGLQTQPPLAGALAQPHWGMFSEALDALAPDVHERLRAVVSLADPGDAPSAEKTLVRLSPDSYARIGSRRVRAIKLKGIGARLGEIKRGAARHIRLAGRGDIPLLVPYLTPAGEERNFAFDVGEPYGAKRFRSTLNETVIARIAWTNRCAVAAPLGVGVYRDAELRFKGEPAGFSIWGVEHPEDVRFDAQWRRRIGLDRERVQRTGASARGALEESLEWTRARLRRIVEEARRYHAAGLVHHEPQFDNHAFYENSLSVLDWEEAAHCSRLTRAQYFESVLIDLYKLACYCCAYEDEYSALMAHAGAAEAAPATSLNWLGFYFHGIDRVRAAALGTLLPARLHEYGKRGAFRHAVLPLIEADYSGLPFGDGVDWDDVARPFLSGFSADAPRWQPEASTAFDLKLFVRKGTRGIPGSERAVHPTAAIGEAENALYEGRFVAAGDAYQRLLESVAPEDPHRNYLCHNLAALCLALRQDSEAAGYFRAAYGADSGRQAGKIAP